MGKCVRSLPFYVSSYISLRENLCKVFVFKMHKVHILCNILRKVLLQLQFSAIEYNWVVFIFLLSCIEFVIAVFL